MISEKMEKEYIKERGTKCITCKSDQLEGYALEVNRGTVWQKVSCSHCGATWTDVYELSGIEENNEK